MKKRNLCSLLLLLLVCSPATSKDLFKTITQPHTLITGDKGAVPQPQLPNVDVGKILKGGGGSGPINPNQPLPKQSQPDPRPEPHFPTLQQELDTWNKAIETAVQLLDVGQDLITFGGHGRQRDIDRANTEEDKSKLVREGSQKAKIEKTNGLKNQIQDKDREIRRWKELIAKFPVVSGQQDALIDFAKARLQYLAHLQNNLDMASKAVQDSDAALRTFVSLVRSSKAQGATRAADVWDDVLQTLTKSLKGSHRTTSAYIEKAIEQGSSGAVTEFLTELSYLRGTLQTIQEIQQQNLDSCLKEKQTLENQLAELNK